jgi:SAM-dependent methyltransferase
LLARESELELARPDAQAVSIAKPTAVFLRSAGAAPSGCATGAVVGIDQAAAMIGAAEQHRVATGIENVRFVEADVRSFHDDDAFDAVVGRLILFHLPHAVEVIRHHVEGLDEGGLMLMIDFDVGSTRSARGSALRRRPTLGDRSGQARQREPHDRQVAKRLAPVIVPGLSVGRHVTHPRTARRVWSCRHRRAARTSEWGRLFVLAWSRPLSPGRGCLTVRPTPAPRASPLISSLISELS